MVLVIGEDTLTVFFKRFARICIFAAPQASGFPRARCYATLFVRFEITMVPCCDSRQVISMAILSLNKLLRGRCVASRRGNTRLVARQKCIYARSV